MLQKRYKGIAKFLNYKTKIVNFLLISKYY